MATFQNNRTVGPDEVEVTITEDRDETPMLVLTIEGLEVDLIITDPDEAKHFGSEVARAVEKYEDML